MKDTMANLNSNECDTTQGRKIKSKRRFKLIVDLGIITVPDMGLAVLGGKNRSGYHIDHRITDRNFPNPSHVLCPGDKVHVRAFSPFDSMSATSEEVMNFCREQHGNRFVGAQGVFLVFEQKRHQLPKGFGYISFDKKECLLKSHGADSMGLHRLPIGYAYYDNSFSLEMGLFEFGLHAEEYAFLCFCI